MLIKIGLKEANGLVICLILIGLPLLDKLRKHLRPELDIVLETLQLAVSDINC
jgi:hypothetical protein